MAALEEAMAGGDLTVLKAAIVTYGAAAEDTDALVHAEQTVRRLAEQRKEEKKKRLKEAAGSGGNRGAGASGGGNGCGAFASLATTSGAC